MDKPSGSQRLSNQVFYGLESEASIDPGRLSEWAKRFLEKLVKAYQIPPLPQANFALKKLGFRRRHDIVLTPTAAPMGGWSAYAARLDWDRELNEARRESSRIFTVLTCWEACLMESLTTPELAAKMGKCASMLSQSM